MEDNAFSHQCFDGVCHCDFRLSIYHCVESNVLYNQFLAAFIMASINSVIGTGILIQRLVLQSQSVFDKRSLGNRFFLRPRPIDSLFFFTTLFSTLWMIDFIILLMDLFPNYHVLRSILFDLPLQLCTDTCSLYMLSLLQRFSQTVTIENEDHHVEIWWLHWFGCRSSFTINLIWLEWYCGIMLTIFPFFVNNTLSLVIGLLADNGKIAIAELITRLHFGIWTMTSSTIWFLFIYSLQRINTLYPSSLSINSNQSLQISFYRNKIFLTTLNYCSGLFVFLFLFYCLFRSNILKNTPILLMYCSCWIFVPLVTQLALQVTYILHPQILLLSMLKVKGFEDYPNGTHQQQQQQHLPHQQKETETEHSFTSGIPSSIRPPSISPHVYTTTAAAINYLKRNSSSSPSPSPPLVSPISSPHHRPPSPHQQSAVTNEKTEEVDDHITDAVDHNLQDCSISNSNSNSNSRSICCSTLSHSTSSPSRSTNSLSFNPSPSTTSTATTLSKLSSDVTLKK